MTIMKRCPFCNAYLKRNEERRYNRLIYYYAHPIETTEQQECFLSGQCFNNSEEWITKWNKRVPIPRKCCANCGYRLGNRCNAQHGYDIRDMTEDGCLFWKSEEVKE